MFKRIALFFAACLCCAIAASPRVFAETNHAQDRYYALITPASSGFGDTGKKLTDGKTGSRVTSGKAEYYYKDGAYVGFNRVSSNDGCFSIIIDLGKAVDGISRFEVSALCETDIGIYEPQSIKISVCDIFDGDYRSVAEYQNTVRTAGGISEPCMLCAVPKQNTSGRYIRFDIYCLNDRSGWVFIDELRVIGGDKTDAEVAFVDVTAQKTEKRISVGYLPWVLIGVGCGLITFAVLRRNRA